MCREEIESKLNMLLADMDVPDCCRELNFRNVAWLLRNLGIRNRQHENYNEVYNLLKQLYKCMI